MSPVELDPRKHQSQNQLWCLARFSVILENRDIGNSSDVWLVGKHVMSASSNDRHAEEGKHLLRIAAILVIDQG